MTPLKNKCVIVSGGTYEARMAYIDQAKKEFTTGREKNVFVLGEGLKTYDKYLKSVVRECPVDHAYTSDGLDDIHLDWARKKTFAIDYTRILNMLGGSPDASPKTLESIVL